MSSTAVLEREEAIELGGDPGRPSRPERGRVARLLTGKPEDPAWVRPALLTLLSITAVLYLWDLGASGWANSFYSAAVQAGTKSWKAFFFGSSDSSNFITVDKPPASLWVMEISARVLGLNSWSVLVPQALEGVASVGLLYATVRRWFSPAAALIAGSVLAVSPVAALMFRYNNPDALLTLLLIGSAYCTIRAIERSGTRWLVLAGALVGFGFITKMLQAFLVLPALGLAYLLASSAPLRRRILQLLYAAIALLVSAGWWVAAVQLTPAADRPYIGGSQDNSLLGLIFGYNGFGRLDGSESGSVTGGAISASNVWGPTGIGRLFNSSFGGQISWLMPAALILLVGTLWMTRSRPRTDRARAALVVFGGWLLVTGLVLSFAKGIIHPYYTIVLAPAVGALMGIGAVHMWRQRSLLVARALMGTTVAATAVWSYVLLDRTPAWLSPLKLVVLTVGLVTASLFVVTPGLRGRSRFLIAGAAIAGACVSIAGPLAYTINTVATPHSGAIPSAGPALVSAVGGFGGAPGGFNAASPGGASRAAGAGFAGRGIAGPRSGGTASGGTGASGSPGPTPPGRPSGGIPTGGSAVQGTGRNAGGGSSGFLNSSTPGSALVKLLEQDASKYTWVAATVGSDSASGYQLATDDAVMAIGGFNGTDPAPTLAQFEEYVSQHKIHWFILTSGPGSGSSGSDASQITSWVASHYSSQTLDGTTIYNLAG
jgi:4-amino-4-deoxy-L-arabinose transferase-like glycosyltransferase